MIIEATRPMPHADGERTAEGEMLMWPIAKKKKNRMRIDVIIFIVITSSACRHV